VGWQDAKTPKVRRGRGKDRASTRKSVTSPSQVDARHGGCHSVEACQQPVDVRLVHRNSWMLRAVQQHRLGRHRPLSGPAEEAVQAGRRDRSDRSDGSDRSVRSYAAAGVVLGLAGLSWWLAAVLQVQVGIIMMFTGLVALIIASVAAALLSRRLGKCFTYFRRSQEELDRNLAWIKTTLVHSGR